MSFVSRGTAVIFCLALVFAALAGASPALGEEEKITVKQCDEQWELSSASGKSGGCHLSEDTEILENKCGIKATCLITAYITLKPHRDNSKLVPLESVSGLKRCGNGHLLLKDEKCYD